MIAVFLVHPVILSFAAVVLAFIGFVSVQLILAALGK